MMHSFIQEKVCPICGKTFVPAPCHRWTIHTRGNPRMFVCTYACMRKWEIPRLEAEKKKAEKKKGR